MSKRDKSSLSRSSARKTRSNGPNATSASGRQLFGPEPHAASAAGGKQDRLPDGENPYHVWQRVQGY